MQKIIGVSYGHNDNYNKGANGFKSEDELNREVGLRVITLLNTEGVLKGVRLYKDNVTSYEDSLNYRPLLANNLGCDIIIDIHHNAFNMESANGSEILCCSERAEQVGLKILKEMELLGYKNRGIKYNTYAFNRLSKMTSLIYEGFFVTNKADCSRYNPDQEANAIVQGLYNFYGIKRPSITNKRQYIVISGDTLYGISKRVGTTVADLVEQNNIVDKNKIYVGQTLYY